MRRQHMEPQEVAVWQFRKNLPCVFETCDWPVAYPHVVRKSYDASPQMFEIQIFIDAASET